MTHEEFDRLTKGRVGDWILTHSGIPFFILDPRQEEIEIKDIAWALSQLNRYTGHTAKPYSVALHSLIISFIVKPELALWGLLHDAHEAYTGDINGPLKGMLKEKFPEYKLWEENLQGAICQKYGLPVFEPEEVKLADRMMIRPEMEHYMPNFPFSYDWSFNRLPVGMFFKRYQHFSPEGIYMEFMDRFQWLTEGIGKNLENKYPNPFYPETLVRRYF